jgi:ankyrin repeat protein
MSNLIDVIIDNKLSIHKRIKTIKRLLRVHPEQVDLVDNNGDTALNCANRNGHNEVAKLLLEAGHTNDRRDTYLNCVSCNGYTQVVKLLHE